MLGSDGTWVNAGDVFEISTPGDGGFGHPQNHRKSKLGALGMFFRALRNIGRVAKPSGMPQWTQVALCVRPPISYPVPENKEARNARSFEQGVECIMSSPQIRRADRAMPAERTLETLAQGYSGRLATVSEDGFPYCIPLLYLWIDGQVYLHTTSARGHLRANIESDQRVCFQIDEQEGVFDYGRFECDSGLAYRSVCLFGRMRIIEDRDAKQRFCEALMAKYGKPETKRPRGFFPRIDAITVYTIIVERMSGKETQLPPLSEQWPAKDRTKTPNASLPSNSLY